MLQEKSMLVYLSFGQPTLRRKDRAASSELTIQKGADSDAADVVKNLFGSSYRPISEFVNTARTFHYENTLPWLDSGLRILSASKYMDYTQKMREFRARWDTHVSAFLNQYDDIRLSEELRMGGLIDNEDYPTRYQLEKRFRFDVQFYPIPTAGDFRIEGIDEIEMEKVRLESARSMDMAGQIAMQEAYSRLSKVVEAMANTLATPGKVFRDSLVENLRSACDLLPSLNVTGDPQFDVMLDEVKRQLTQHNPDTLRHDDAVRAETARKAAAIFAKMEAFV